MVLIGYKWSILAILTLARGSCKLLGDDMKDSTIDDVIMDSINLAALGVAHSYDSLADDIRIHLRISLPAADRDATSQHFEGIQKATKAFVDNFGIDSRIFLTYPTPQTAQSGIHPRPLLKDTGLNTLAERIEVLGDTLIATRNWLRESNYSSKSWYKKKLNNLLAMALNDVPAVWIGPLDNIYVKLNIQDPTIARGEIYNRKMGLLGVYRFQMINNSGIIPSDRLTATRGHRLLLNSAMGLIERMFEAIKKNITPEQVDKIDKLYEVYKTHINIDL